MDAKDFFQNFEYHPNAIDSISTLTIGNNEKITGGVLASYKAIYREVYYRRKDIARARALESNQANKESVFPEALIEPGSHETLQAYLAKFYGKNINKIPDEKRFNIFGPKLQEMKMKFVDKDRKVEDIPKDFENKSLSVLTGIPPYTSGKNTFEYTLPGWNEKIILPSWDLSAGDLEYKFIRENGRYLIRVVDTKNPPPE